MRNYAAQVKHEQSIGQGRSIDDLLSQVRQAFAKPFKRSDSPRECHVSAVYVFNSGAITPNAKEQFLSALEQDRYGDNVLLFDGERLDALNQWATLQSDRSARSRLLGLRSALRFIIAELPAMSNEEIFLRPPYTPGIELYLSEPVNCDDAAFLKGLFDFWALLKSIERVQTLCSFPSRAYRDTRAKLWPGMKGMVEAALNGAPKLCTVIDAALDKMKPLE
jgi:hypothetical protein